VDFEVEFGSFLPKPSRSSLAPPSSSSSSSSFPLRPGRVATIYDSYDNGYLNYRITHVVPHSADGWVYGYVRRARMFLMLYNRQVSSRARGDDPLVADTTSRAMEMRRKALAIGSAGGDSSGSPSPWRKLIDVKGLVRYDWNLR
jgi:hypothetical protein